MFDRVSPPAGMRPLSLIRPSAWPLVRAHRPAAADRRLTGAGRGGSPSGECGCRRSCPGPACPRRGLHATLGLSGAGERVVAELGQDVAGVPDDLAGLRQGGALAVLAVLHRGVVAVVGAAARPWVLPASYTAQRNTGGPCRDSRPGGPLRSEDQTVMSSPVNRTALREEENRPAPPSQQVSASAAIGPTPYNRSASTLAPVSSRAVSRSCLRSGPSRASMAASMSSAVATCNCPAADKCAAAAARSPARPCPVRNASSLSGGAP